MDTDTTTTVAESATRTTSADLNVKPCVCGAPGCELAFEHRRAWAGSETYWREVAIKPVRRNTGGV